MPVLESVGLEGTGLGLNTEHCALQSTGLLLWHSWFGFLNSNRNLFILGTWSTLSWDGLSQRWIWEQSFVRSYLSVWGKLMDGFNAVVRVSCVGLGSDGIKLLRFFVSLGFLFPGFLNNVLSVLPNISEHTGKTFSPAPPKLSSVITQLLLSWSMLWRKGI